MSSILKSIAVLSLLGLVTSQFLSNDIGEDEIGDLIKNRFGSMEEVVKTTQGIRKTVHKPLTPFYKDYARQTEFLQQAQEQIQLNKDNEATGNLYTCSNREGGDKDSSGYFIPIFVADLKNNGQSITYTEGTCFQSIKFAYTTTINQNGLIDATLTIDASRPKSLLCKDWFFIGNTDLQHVETVSDKGIHTVTFTGLNQDESIDMGFEGVKIYMFCDGYIDTFISAMKTFLCFAGGLTYNPEGGPITGSHVPPYMEQANVDFMKNTMGWTLEERSITEYEYDTNLIQSGDFLAILRLDGLDPLVMYGSGSHAGHSTMALRFDGELYVVESQDAWYWPVQSIQRNKWSDWIQYAKNADFHVTHMPLRPDIRTKFNEKAAQDFFFETEGVPYGYHNFLFGWVDTPEDNWPPLLPAEFAPILMDMVYKVMPSAAESFYVQAINKRLGTEGLTMEQLATEASRQGMTMDEVGALPEIDGWQYSDGVSYVCSAYVAAMYKAAGLFDDLEINATEFTPRDVYTLDFFDMNYQRPQACAEADPDMPWCQLTGKYRMTFPGYSSIKPYNRMAERCPSIAPEYVRPDGC